MKSVHFSIHSAPIFSFNPNNLTSSSSSSSPIALLRPCKFSSLSLRSTSKPSRLITLCAPNSAKATSYRSESAAPVPSNEAFIQALNDTSESQWTVEVGNPSVPSPSVARLSLSDQAFFLLAFIACTTSVAFTSLVIAAVPTLCAMGKAAISLSKLADTAREELPSTMAAVRLSGMEISDLTLELNDLSQEIADGVTKSTQAVQAAEAGIRQIGTLAHQRTMSMIQERANLPIISLQPAVVGAAKKTSHVVGQATRNLINIISRRDDSENEEDAGIDRLEI